MSENTYQPSSHDRLGMLRESIQTDEVLGMPRESMQTDEVLGIRKGSISRRNEQSQRRETWLGLLKVSGVEVS